MNTTIRVTDVLVRCMKKMNPSRQSIIDRMIDNARSDENWARGLISIWIQKDQIGDWQEAIAEQLYHAERKVVDPHSVYANDYWVWKSPTTKSKYRDQAFQIRTLWEYLRVDFKLTDMYHDSLYLPRGHYKVSFEDQYVGFSNVRTAQKCIEVLFHENQEFLIFDSTYATEKTFSSYKDFEKWYNSTKG